MFINNKFNKSHIFFEKFVQSTNSTNSTNSDDSDDSPFFPSFLTSESNSDSNNKSNLVTSNLVPSIIPQSESKLTTTPAPAPTAIITSTLEKKDSNLANTNNIVSQINYLVNLPEVTKNMSIQLQPKKIITAEQNARAEIGTVKMITEFSKIYPIGTNFDLQFNNYNNLLANSSISLLNEIFSNVKYKANEKSIVINFNPGFKQTKSLYLVENDVSDYAKYFTSLMNSVSTMGNSFILNKVIPISKEQLDGQIRLNFHIEVKYNYPKSKKESIEITPTNFTLVINVVMLFEKTVYTTQTNTYLESFELLGISEFGFLPGYSK